MSRPQPPALEPQLPVCTLCGEEVEHDVGDGFHCPRCLASWPEYGIGHEAGEWVEGDQDQCEAIDGRFLPGGCYSTSNPNSERFRCMYGIDHERAHLWGDGYSRHCWEAKDSATPAQLAAVSP